MLQEPWITFLLLFAGAGGVIAIALVHTWITDRAAVHREREAASHSAE
jgi:hypothetical protein